MFRYPSDHYFSVVQTEEDYRKFLQTGMAWEWENSAPETWAEHLEIKEAWLKHREFDGS